MEREEEKRKQRLTVGADQPDVDLEPLPVRVHQTFLDKVEAFGWSLLSGVIAGIIVAIALTLF